MSDLTIAMPVYNGERYLADALEAILGQTCGDFSFVISDNASTDATPDILAHYARNDARICIVRQPENIGGAGNYLYLLEHATTPYFMFAAHDDVFAPTAVKRCLAGLLADPAAAICTADVAFIHEAGDPLKLARNLDTAGLDLPDRAHALLSRFGWYAVYGVARLEPLLATRPFTNRYGADVVQTMQLLLHGHIRSVPETLFYYRVPSTWFKSPEEQQLAIDHDTPVVSKPYSTMIGDLVARVRRSDVDRVAVDAVLRTVRRTIAFENHQLRAQLFIENSVAVNIEDNDAILSAVHEIMNIDMESWPR